MYLSYYNLSKKPFQISTDPNFFWLGEKHKEALSILKYGVMDDKGFLLLTGDVGTGKTTLINAFVNSLGEDVIISRVSDPGLTQIDFINYIAKLFKIEAGFETKSEFLILFTEFLEQAHKDDKKVLLIIDEAQQLTDETLEEIRLLSNIENQDKKLLNIFLVGQSEFNETLEKYKNRALRQRLTLNITLYPLKPEETKACIEYRLKIAGCKNDLFTPDAIDAIHTISNGFPRVINIVCDHALRLGCQEEQKVISPAIIHHCSKSIYALQRPHSDHHGSYIGANNEWLEESEVPPLSPEAIDRISQPLPDFITENEVETKEKTRPYGIAVPLVLTALFITGYFLLKDDHLTTLSNVITSLKKSTLAAIGDNDPTITDFGELLQKNQNPLPSTTISITEDSTTPPRAIEQKQIKQRFRVEDTKEALKVEKMDRDLPNVDEGVKTDISAEVAQEIKTSVTTESIISNDPNTSFKEVAAVDGELIKQEPVVPDVAVTPSVNTGEVSLEESQDENKPTPLQSIPTQESESVSQLPTNNENNTTDELLSGQRSSESPSANPVFASPARLENKTADENKEIKGNVAMTSGAIATENANPSEVLPGDAHEEKNIGPEVREKLPNAQVTTTPADIDTGDTIATKTSPQPKSQSTPEDIAPPVVLTEVKSEPQLPPPSSPKRTKTNEDPGAVIDWLLKAK